MNYYDENYLAHYGVKGMKWGVRRYTNADGSLNAKGIKKYARAGYAQDSYNSNKTKLGKAYDKVTGAHKYGGDMMYNMSSDKARKARAEKYVADQEAAKFEADAKRQAKRDAKENKKTIREQEKQYGSLEDAYVYDKKTSKKDLQQAYGQLENSISYSKRANKKANEYAQKALNEIDRQLSQTGKKPTYDAKRVNEFVDKALKAVEDDLNQRRNNN